MKIYVIILVLIISALSACNYHHKGAADQKVTVSEVMLPPASEKEADIEVSKPLAPAESAGNVEKKIVKEGEISFETNDVTKTRNSIYNSLKKLDGYIAEETQTNNNDEGNKQYIIRARVPAKNFEVFLNGVVSGGERIDTKNIRIRDVTTDYIDISSQLVNKRALEARYLELLKKGTKIKDLLEIEDKVAEIRSDIESTQGSFNYLVKQVAYSSLNITFYAKPSVKENTNTFGYRLTTAFSGGGAILGSLFFGFISVWPLWLLALGCYFIIRLWRKKYVKTVE